MKFFRACYLFIALMLMLTTPVHAYLDPSVASYAIQAVAGILITVGVGIGIYWRKMKKKTMDKLGIDENAKKEIEEDVIEFTQKNPKR